MQISDLTNQYTSTNASAESVGGTRGVETLVSAVRNLTVGNIFEGSVNSIKGNQVVLGLSNGAELAARIEANMQLVQGQSMFFQVKSNDGNTIAIRPYTVDGSGANLTLLNALKAANLPVQDRYLTMANTMMQEQMPIDRNSMAQMARILMNNPGMNVQTLVLMKKFDIPITTEMVAQFENYMDDKSVLHKALDTFINELPSVLSSKNMSLEQMKAFDSQLLLILADDMQPENNSSQVNGQMVTDGQQVVGDQQATGGQQVTNGQQVVGVSQSTSGQQIVEGQQVAGAPQAQVGQQVAGDQQTIAGQQMAEGQQVVADQQVVDGQQLVDGQQVIEGQQVIGDQQAIAGQQAVDGQHIVGDQQTTADQQAINMEKVQALIKELFGDIGITGEDSSSVLLQKLASHIATGKNVSQETLNTLFSSKDVQSFLKDIIEGQMLLKPEDVANGEKIKKLYDRMEAKTASIENLLQTAGLKDTPLAQVVSDIHANIDFMNQLNQAYTFAQIPLKMSNQNASGQLYVYTSKRNLDDPERDLTAFLHLDLEHLGATDVSVRMHKKEVSTKFYMDNDAAYDLVKAHMSELEARIRAKGYNCKIEIINEGNHVDFVEDFLKKDAPSTGLLHRYSFDVRA